jgi:hypothetical protein
MKSVLEGLKPSERHQLMTHAASYLLGKNADVRSNVGLKINTKYQVKVHILSPEYRADS